jgi:hypothetical protein
MALLAASGIKPGGPTALLEYDAQEAAKALQDKSIDMAFVMSESASTDIMHALLHSTDIHLFSFRQAVAFSRKMDYLNHLTLPEGVIDFGLDLPHHDVELLGPTVELIARKSLHPAISDLLLEAATEVHGRAGVFQHRGEFPAPVEHVIRLSPDAVRYIKSGKSFLYRYLPFWLASLGTRVVLVFVPLLVILIPALRSVPAFFRWRTQSRIYRHYRALLRLEQACFLDTRLREREDLHREFDQINESVNRMKVPASFADQFYNLRGHIDYVRQLLARDRAVP